MDNLAGLIFTTYLLAGILFLVIFNMVTGRINSQLTNASYDVQIKLANAGQHATLIGRKTAIILLVILIIVFWPGVVVGAIQRWKGDRK